MNRIASVVWLAKRTETRMWVFDGEQWTQDEGEEQRNESAAEPMRIEELMAELQVIEIVRPQRGQVPPPPL
jgi:hypothetical protein